VFDNDCGAWDSMSACYVNKQTYPYLQVTDHGDTLKRVYWMVASQNYYK